jgi:hypothetical protein
VLLIAKHLRGEPRHRPPSVARPALLGELTRVLTAYHCPAERSEVDADDVATAVDRVAARYLGLLTILGPRAVAADPLLPVRLLGLPPLPELPPAARELLNRRPIGGQLRHQGSGTEGGYTGLAKRGPLHRLLPRELAVRTPSLAARFANHDLLYRSAEGADPLLRSTVVLILDDTPPAFGRVGVTLRSVAHLICVRQLGAEARVAVIGLGEPEDLRWIAKPADLVLLWDHWRIKPARPTDAARVLGAVRGELVDGATGPSRPILLTQPFQSFPDVTDLRRVDVVRPGAAPDAAPPGRHRLITDPSPDEIQRVLAELAR